MADDPVPFLDLVTPHRELENDLVEAFRQALRSAAFVGGKELEGFEREFAEYCGVKYCVGVANGTDAVRFALMASGVGPGDAVVTVSHTFIATVEAISQAGAGTEFVDIDERTYCIEPGCARGVPEGLPEGPCHGPAHRQAHRQAHQGRPAGPPLRSGRRHGRHRGDRGPFNLLVVEDACQAHGAEYRSADGGWRRTGTFGKAAAFSFYPGKNLGACGEGGAVTTNDEQVAKTIKMLREHGQAQKSYHDLEGYNGRLHSIQAAFLRVKLRHLDAWTAGRRDAAARYAGLFAKVPGVTVPHESDNSRAVYHLYVIRTKDRDGLGEHLKAQGVFTGLHYPVPVHLQKCYRHSGYGTGSFPVTERVCGEILSLPMFPTLTAEQQQRTADAIAAFTKV